VALFFYLGMTSFLWNVKALPYLSEGGVCTLVGLTITDYVGETVLGKPCNYLHRKTLMYHQVAVDDFDILPGCRSASVPQTIAGYWYNISSSSLTLFNITHAFSQDSSYRH
jgi:hypothetical protein